MKKSVKAVTRGNNVLDQILTNMSDLYDDMMHLPRVFIQSVFLVKCDC